MEKETVMIRYEYGYTLTLQDYTDFQINAALHNPAIRKSIKQNTIVVVAVMSAIFIASLLILETFLRYIVPVGAMFYAYYTIKHSEKHFIKRFTISIHRILEKRDMSKILGEKHVILTNDSIELQESSGTVRERYQSFREIRETESAVLLFRDTVSALIIPKRVFKNSEEKNVFLAYIESRIKKETQ